MDEPLIRHKEVEGPRVDQQGPLGTVELGAHDRELVDARLRDVVGPVREGREGPAVRVGEVVVAEGPQLVQVAEVALDAWLRQSRPGRGGRGDGPDSQVTREEKGVRLVRRSGGPVVRSGPHRAVNPESNVSAVLSVSGPEAGGKIKINKI